MCTVIDSTNAHAMRDPQCRSERAEDSEILATLLCCRIEGEGATVYNLAPAHEACDFTGRAYPRYKQKRQRDTEGQPQSKRLRATWCYIHSARFWTAAVLLPLLSRTL